MVGRVCSKSMSSSLSYIYCTFSFLDMGLWQHPPPLTANQPPHYLKTMPPEDSSNKEANYVSDEDASSSTSTTSTTSTTISSAQSLQQHPYMGMDSHAEEEIRSLARSLTKQSFISNASATASATANANANATASLNDHLETQSIFSTDLPGVNPIYSTSDAPGYDPRLDPSSGKFSSKAWVQNMANLTNNDPDFYKPYSLGCTWKNLSASGDSADVTYQSTFQNLPWKLITSLYRLASPLAKQSRFQILKPMDGCLPPGELLVVLGRPGAGCTTLLKSISSNTDRKSVV